MAKTSKMVRARLIGINVGLNVDGEICSLPRELAERLLARGKVEIIPGRVSKGKTFKRIAKEQSTMDSARMSIADKVRRDNHTGEFSEIEE